MVRQVSTFLRVGVSNGLVSLASDRLEMSWGCLSHRSRRKGGFTGLTSGLISSLEVGDDLHKVLC